MRTRIRDAFQGKRVVVTGAADGLGLALTNRLLEAGATVGALDINDEALKKLADSSPQPSLTTYQVDVSDQQRMTDVFDDFCAGSAPLDYVFNNAGMVIGGEMQHMTFEQWNKIMSVNEGGAIVGSHLAYQRMVEQGSGHIINTSSTAGIVPVPSSVAYTCSKFASLGLSLALAEEAKAQGVRVSVIIPGVLDTGIFDRAVNVKSYDYKKQMSRPWIQKMKPHAAAEYILKRVARGKRMIVVPGNIWGLIAFYRLAPHLTMKIMRMSM